MLQRQLRQIGTAEAELQASSIIDLTGLRALSISSRSLPRQTASPGSDGEPAAALSLRDGTSKLLPVLTGRSIRQASNAKLRNTRDRRIRLASVTGDRLAQLSPELSEIFRHQILNRPILNASTSRPPTWQ